MKRFAWNDSWKFKAFLAVVFLGSAVALPFVSAERLIVTLIGLALVGFSGYRTVRFIKHNPWDNARIRKVNWVETVVHLALGSFLIYWIWAQDAELGSLLGYLIGGVFVARGSVHFYSDQNKETNEDVAIFVLHLGAIIGGTYIFFDGEFTAGVLLGFIVVMLTRKAIQNGLAAFKLYRALTLTPQTPSLEGLFDTAEAQASKEPLAPQEEAPTPEEEDASDAESKNPSHDA